MNNQIVLPENTDEWKFEPLVSIEPADLPAQQSIVIPVRITRLKDGNEAKQMARSAGEDLVGNFSNCMAYVKALYQALCGDELKNNESMEKMAMKMCALAATGATIFDYLSGFFGGGGVGGPVGGYSKSTGNTNNPVITEKTFDMCDPCDAKKAEELFDVLIGKTFLAPVNSALNDAYFKT